MKYGLYFDNKRIVADLTLHGAAPTGEPVTGALIDSGASISNFPLADLQKVQASPAGINRKVTGATGSTTTATYMVRVELGSSQNLNAVEAYHKAQVEQKAVHVIGLASRVLIGRDVLARFNCLELDWSNGSVIDAGYA